MLKRVASDMKTIPIKKKGVKTNLPVKRNQIDIDATLEKLFNYGTHHHKALVNMRMKTPTLNKHIVHKMQD
jgi:hypothetical protein